MKKKHYGNYLPLIRKDQYHCLGLILVAALARIDLRGVQLNLQVCKVALECYAHQSGVLRFRLVPRCSQAP